jgi:hypothetical protein
VTGPTRRVVVGAGSDGRSTVLADGPVEARIGRPSGAVVEEVWRQELLPAREGDDGATQGEMNPKPPPHGASMRVFSLPPEGTADPTAPTADELGAAYGVGNLRVQGEGRPILHKADSLYIGTVVSGAAYLLHEDGEVLLRTGDSLVLQGAMHEWRNPFDEVAKVWCAVFAQVGAADGAEDAG